MRRDTRNAPCPGVQVNRRVPDFHCDKLAGHTEPHVDPKTGRAWRYPKYPYGVRARRNA